MTANLGTFGRTTGYYVHDQGAHGGPSDVWTVNHDLGFRPGGITVEDTSGQQWDGRVEHIDDTTLTLSFNAPFSGFAYIS